jgi:hypothetical protein
MDLSGEPSLSKVARWHVFEDLGGLKVGLLGYIAGDTGALTSAGKFLDGRLPLCCAAHPAG